MQDSSRPHRQPHNMNGSDNLDFLDILTVLGFVVSVENLNQNLSQNDKQDLQNDLADKSDKILQEIHSHLELQDAKLEWIMEKLNEKD